MVILESVLERGHSLDVPAEIGLGYLGDTNVKVTFSESDRKDLMQIEPRLVLRLCKSLGEITTHEEMCRLLMGSKWSDLLVVDYYFPLKQKQRNLY